MPSVLLPDRIVVLIKGPDAEHLLQNLVTTDLDALKQGEAKAGALLTPQGKIMFDFLVSRDGDDGLRIDMRSDVVDDFMRRMMMYKLRAKADISKQEQLLVAARWGDEPAGSQVDSSGSENDSTRFADTRFRLEPVWREYVSKDTSHRSYGPPLPRGERNLDPDGAAQASSLGSSPLWGEVVRRTGEGFDESLGAYTRLRIANAVAESGSDFTLSDAFPHDVLLEQFDGVGFSKGCYVGQEVVSRIKHRGTARRRVLIVRGASDLPPSGTDLTVNGRAIGALGSTSGADGLAIVRIDKVKAALDAGQPILAGETEVSLTIPSWASFSFPADAAGDE